MQVQLNYRFFVKIYSTFNAFGNLERKSHSHNIPVKLHTYILRTAHFAKNCTLKTQFQLLYYASTP